MSVSVFSGDRPGSSPSARQGHDDNLLRTFLKRARFPFGQLGMKGRVALLCEALTMPFAEAPDAFRIRHSAVEDGRAAGHLFPKPFISSPGCLLPFVKRQFPPPVPGSRDKSLSMPPAPFPPSRSSVAAWAPKTARHEHTKIVGRRFVMLTRPSDTIARIEERRLPLPSSSTAPAFQFPPRHGAGTRAAAGAARAGLKPPFRSKRGEVARASARQAGRAACPRSPASPAEPGSRSAA